MEASTLYVDKFGKAQVTKCLLELSPRMALDCSKEAFGSDAGVVGDRGYDLVAQHGGSH